MTRATDLYRDICINSRSTEHSRRVANAWNSAAYPYKVDIPALKLGKGQCRDSYLAITAECLLYREKILGLTTVETLARADEILSARPFGSSTPTYAELSNSQVRMAAAFVPLTPDEGCSSDDPVLARLYCVSGLRDSYPIPFVDGADEAGIGEFSWFLSGIEMDSNDGGIVGRSWLLAANLLMETIKRNDAATAKNLILNFIVTGDVANGTIAKVDMGRKQELDKPEFRNYKWIVPMKNANEMNLIPSRRIEKPATLDEAYKLIETMQNTLTRGLYEVVKKPITRAEDLPDGNALADMLAKGADACGAVEGQSPWGRYRDSLYCRMNKAEIEMPFLENAGRIDRMFSYYGSIPQFFFMLAHVGQFDQLKGLSAVFDINAIDYDGETALDFAETENDSRAKDLLIQCGATKRGRFLPGSSMFARALNSLKTDTDWGMKKAERWICEALDNGLNPNETIQFAEVEPQIGRFFAAPVFEDKDDIFPKGDVIFASCPCYTYAFIYEFYETTTLLEALYAGSRPIVEKCVEKGLTSDIKIRVKYNHVLIDCDGKPTGEDPTKLKFPNEWPESWRLSDFIDQFSKRNEFPDRELVDRVLKVLKNSK